jgi:hypothetical protein
VLPRRHWHKLASPPRFEVRMASLHGRYAQTTTPCGSKSRGYASS